MSRRLRESLLGLALLVPSAIIFVWFFFYPLYRLFVMGLYQPNRTGTAERYVGWGQYSDVLTGEQFTEGVKITFTYVLYTVPLGLVLGVLLAVAANRRLKGIKVFQSIFSSTVATSVAVASVIFFVLLNPQVGYFSDISCFSLANTDSALRGVALSSVWQNLGLTFVIVLAGLQAVPDEVQEAATLDGYGPVRRFFKVTLPLISPTLMFLAVVLVIFALQAFAQIDILTQGGPARLHRDAGLQDLQQPATGRPGRRRRARHRPVRHHPRREPVQFLILDRRVHYGN